ncbi:thiamine ABC transporter substrate binding subunit [Reinekea marinisedimentorum]|uniref:Thiamine-binding periplasmic protein n=1 Tax=Reinekea marinisedimentorum TaxID=230495 RepID=A0A4R3HZT4_9GAMM|nr:thiamine ABC transporter substrate binding subunit [Reinekea marinisedimentorum]TCS38916.1 thiamine transport system substrate-binding protein [Reinekea marinisedimentorum]
MKVSSLIPFTIASLSAVSFADTLTVYTYQSFTSEWGPGPAIEEKFEAQCGCDLELIGLEDGVSLLNRLKLEGKQTQADVVLGLDDALLEETKSLGILADHGLSLSNLSLPYAFNDEQFVPYDYGHFAFIYDETKVSDVPGSLKELVEDSELSIIYQDPRISTPGQGLMLWVKSVYGENSDEAWKQLKQKTLTVTPGWSEAYSLFLEGKGDMVLSYVTSPAYHMTWEDTDKYKAAEFSEGHYVQVETAAALSSSKQPELAKSFLAFLISKDAQDVFAGTNWMWPVLPEAEKPEAFSLLIQPKTLYFPSAEVNENRSRWIKEWRSAVSQ